MRLLYFGAWYLLTCCLRRFKMSAQLSYSSTYMFESNIVRILSKGSVKLGSSLLLCSISLSLVKVKHPELSSQYVLKMEFCFKIIELVLM